MSRRLLLSALLLILTLSPIIPMQTATAYQVDETFSPASGPAQVIAQGVAELPAGDAVWRTVRTRALLPAEAAFEEQPLGFVVASAAPLLLVDEASGAQTRLGTGEAAFTPAGTVQQRSSLGAGPVSYLSIELVAADAPPPPAGATVLQPGQPFPAPSGLYDLDLLSATLGQGDAFTIPDSGAKNVVLITDGAAGLSRGGGEPVVLLAGEAASFSGALDIAPAPDGGEEGFVSFVVAMIGVPVLPVDSGEPAAAAVEPATGLEPAADADAELAAPDAAAGPGAIAIQVFACPPGMNAQTVAAAACAPMAEGFAATLSGDALPAPLSLADAASDGAAIVWSGLPYGEYVLSDIVLPAGIADFSLSAANATGDADTGYALTLDETNPEMPVRVYLFSPG